MGFKLEGTDAEAHVELRDAKGRGYSPECLDLLAASGSRRLWRRFSRRNNPANTWIAEPSAPDLGADAVAVSIHPQCFPLAALVCNAMQLPGGRPAKDTGLPPEVPAHPSSVAAAGRGHGPRPGHGPALEAPWLTPAQWPLPGLFSCVSATSSLLLGREWRGKSSGQAAGNPTFV